MPATVTIGDVRSLMGVVGFLRGYVPHIVEHLAPTGWGRRAAVQVFQQ